MSYYINYKKHLLCKKTFALQKIDRAIENYFLSFPINFEKVFYRMIL